MSTAQQPQTQYPYEPSQAAVPPYPPMARPAVPRQTVAATGHPDLPTRPIRAQTPVVAQPTMPRPAKPAVAPRMPKAQALQRVRGLKKAILGVTLGSFVAFATLAATHLNTSGASASASSTSANTSSASSGSASSGSSGSNTSSSSSSSGFGFGSSSSSQSPVSGSSSS